MKLYVGNLPFDITEESLRTLFQAYGDIVHIDLIADQLSGRPKGFAFIEMASRSGGQQAMEQINKQVYKSRQLVCSEARPQKKTRGRR